jgi:ADP-ribose pyrophosphatase
MIPEKTVSSKTIYRGHVVTLRVDTVTTVDGGQSVREVVEHAPCIAVIPIDNDGNILLVKQYRYALEKELLEIPAGGIEPGEDPEAAVKREMAEETGFSPTTIQRIGGFYSSPGFCNEFLYLFLASDLAPHRLTAEDTESIEVIKVKPGELEGMIKSGTICDSKSVAGILTYLQMQP